MYVGDSQTNSFQWRESGRVRDMQLVVVVVVVVAAR